VIESPSPDIDLEESGDLTQEQRAAELFAQMPDPAAREELVMLYRSLAEYLARRFRSKGEQLDDLIQVASIGLLKAIDRFDPGREVKFSTYAIPTIVGELKRHFRDTGWAVKVPRRLQERSLHLRKVIADLTQDVGHSPKISEIAKRADMTEEEVLEALEAVRAHTAEGLETPNSENDSGPADSLGDDDEKLELLEEWADVAPQLRTLPARERQLLYYRFVCGMPQSQIAEKLGISQMHVSRLLSRTLQQLRDAIGV
jgi:RNA polymerase sigma-B factor